MAWSDDEKTIHDSVPRELYEFVGTISTLRYCSGDADVVFQSNTYTQAIIKRTATKPNTENDRQEVTVRMDRTLQVVTDYALGVPPVSLRLTIYREQESSGNFAKIWEGQVPGFRLEGDEAVLRIPSEMATAMDTNIPSAAYQVHCNHVLYDPDSPCGKGINRDDFKITTTVTSIQQNGVELVINDDGDKGEAEDWLVGGEIIRVADGERRLIMKHTDTSNTIIIDWPFRNLSISDSVEVYAGCDHLFQTCRSKFGNSRNFGGHPYIPIHNLFRVWQGMKGIDS